MTIVIPRPPFDTGIDIVLGSVQAQEVSVQRELTHAFIIADPTEITLRSRSRIRTAAGGWVWVNGAEKAAQSVKVTQIVGVSGENADPVRGIDGIERVVEFVLLCEYDADIDAGDTFMMDGGAYEVIGIAAPLPYEVRALVARHGG